MFLQVLVILQGKYGIIIVLYVDNYIHYVMIIIETIDMG
jgi:hypothetical protein